MKLTYAVIIEQTPSNYGTDAPDVPGCISTAAAPDEMLANIREALVFHIDNLVCGGDPVPVPAMSIDDAIADADAEWLAAAGDVMAALSARFETVDVEVLTLKRRSPGDAEPGIRHSGRPIGPDGSVGARF